MKNQSQFSKLLKINNSLKDYKKKTYRKLRASSNVCACYLLAV